MKLPSNVTLAGLKGMVLFHSYSTIETGWPRIPVYNFILMDSLFFFFFSDSYNYLIYMRITTFSLSFLLFLIFIQLLKYKNHLLKLKTSLKLLELGEFYSFWWVVNDSLTFKILIWAFKIFYRRQCFLYINVLNLSQILGYWN